MQVSTQSGIGQNCGSRLPAPSHWDREIVALGFALTRGESKHGECVSQGFWHLVQL